MSPDLAALFKDADRDLTPVRRAELLQPDRSRETSRPSANHDDVILHRFAFAHARFLSPHRSARTLLPFQLLDRIVNGPEKREMVGTLDQLSHEDARQLLRWWLDAGVDTAVSEEPREWLKPSSANALGKPEADIAAPSPSELPGDYNGFREYLAKATGLPLETAGARRILPHGLPGAKIMLLSDVPAREDAAEDRPIGGEAWLLAERMLAAINIPADAAYSASLACFYAAGARLAHGDVERCAKIARHHVALVKPERLLLLGEAPAKALLGQPLARARGHVHKIEGVRTVVTFHPRWLLQRPSDKALAWRDLLLLMDED